MASNGTGELGVIGGTESELTEIAIIRDSEGEVVVLPSFAFDRPDLYKYIGVVNVNNDRIYYFEYLQ